MAGPLGEVSVDNIIFNKTGHFAIAMPFAILSLIQRALLPRLMVLAPESLAVTLTGSKFVGHLVVLTFKICR
jgi:hypothetical protein